MEMKTSRKWYLLVPEKMEPTSGLMMERMAEAELLLMAVYPVLLIADSI
jgi:hypothetical protein